MRTLAGVVRDSIWRGSIEAGAGLLQRREAPLKRGAIRRIYREVPVVPDAEVRSAKHAKGRESKAPGVRLGWKVWDDGEYLNAFPFRVFRVFGGLCFCFRAERRDVVEFGPRNSGFFRFSGIRFSDLGLNALVIRMFLRPRTGALREVHGKRGRHSD